MMTWNKDPASQTLGMFEFLVLLSLRAMDKKSSAKEIHQHMMTRCKREYSFSAVRTTLSRLNAKGFVERHNGSPIVFEIHHGGQRAIDGSLQSIERIKMRPRIRKRVLTRVKPGTKS